MMNALEMINATVAKGNMGPKQDLLRKNAQYIESFERNNREEEYQAYVSSSKESENKVPCLGRF
ncbi:hypothetical protein QI30_19030 [Kurthia sp. 3B1D]|uniref:Uncharacterized protein n=1 Tax=Candidatus Kurthia intestinigallinarum TaxID=1562256 RepID=A0A433RPA7_9BACL|nr:hypothetical protein [Kurthia sp. 3B1D]RUS50653.1 hypothetical protein QI30_19075 [Kurthia sp. 3B1D]RUS50657.1 hypothetical protein QI30_19060 [Kurthia sp. 3B1D]RUS50659.1 hypothetical protein QI30_19045 [Kurthia sp. 3B1D]RUS50859.1 hypothetical protein QI30_19030 [Kurthia sp. 3B1D]